MGAARDAVAEADALDEAKALIILADEMRTQVICSCNECHTRKIPYDEARAALSWLPPVPADRKP